MEEQTDSTFIKNISIVIAILVVFTFAIAFLARDLGQQVNQGESAGTIALTEERVKPVADVYTGEEGAAAIEQAASAKAEEPSVAFDGSLDAEMIYGAVCAVCHGAGVAGAPVPGSEVWAQRAQKGLDTMVQNALNGLNAMPARGGRADLSDEQVQVAVEFMNQ